ncbi:MAG: manganese efflux pump MntP family protein [Methanomassiliicoccaceae archaeon]|jgi:putative Mn2+ efflux pump MntP|nr:manganese efflux pump MntP family protein [Methanomassiliicoccaceae archaeon]
MSIAELFLIALALSMDAFAVAVCLGLRHKATAGNMFIVGSYFGLFQAVMPLIGYFAATLFVDTIVGYDHWIAFALLSFLGARMIAGSFKDNDALRNGSGSLRPGVMLPLAVATSIDALAVGISFAVIDVNIAPAVLIIGVVTFALAMLGVRIGEVFGMRIGSKAEFAGGVILILIGVKILLEHLGVIGL